MSSKSLFLKNNKFIISFTFFFFLRFIYALLFGWEKIPVGSDGLSYNNYALAILTQSDWLTNANFPGHYREPVYPLFIALIYSLFGRENLYAVYFFQAFLNSLTAYFIYKLSDLIFNKKSSLLAFFWAGFYFYYIFYTGKILREILIFFLIIYSFYYLFKFIKENKPVSAINDKHFWHYIVSFMVLVHTDARYLFYIPFFLIIFIMYKKWIGLKQYCIAVSLFLLLLIPWSVRNYLAYDGFVLINTRTLDIRQNSPVYRLNNLPGFDVKNDNDEAIRLVNKNYPSEAERELIKKGINLKKRSKEEIDAILNNRYPAKKELEKRWYNIRSFWRPFHFTNEYRPWPDCRFEPKNTLSDGLIKLIGYGMLLPFMLLAIITLIARRQANGLFLIFPILIQTLLHVIMWGFGRYRNPIDAFIIILGCYGMFLFYDFIKIKLYPGVIINSNR